MLNRQTQSTILQCTHCHETMQLVHSDWIVHATRICNFDQTARSLTRGNQ
jgi:hypothetical protein